MVHLLLLHLLRLHLHLLRLHGLRLSEAEERKTSWRTELLTEKTGLRLVKRMRVVRHLAASLGQERPDWS